MSLNFSRIANSSLVLTYVCIYKYKFLFISDLLKGWRIPVSLLFKLLSIFFKQSVSIAPWDTSNTEEDQEQSVKMMMRCCYQLSLQMYIWVSKRLKMEKLFVQTVNLRRKMQTLSYQKYIVK